MVPLLDPEVFLPVGFSMRAQICLRDTLHHHYISTCFPGKHLYDPCFCTYYEVQAAHGQVQAFLEAMHANTCQPAKWLWAEQGAEAMHVLYIGF